MNYPYEIIRVAVTSCVSPSIDYSTISGVIIFLLFMMFVIKNLYNCKIRFLLDFHNHRAETDFASCITFYSTEIL
jgi:membrane protein CcdC involved in cytochrome C biogenesis